MKVLYSYLNLPDFNHIPDTKNNEVISYDNSEDLKKIISVMNNYFGIEMDIAHYKRTLADLKYYDYICSLIPELKNNISEIGFQTMSNRNNHKNGSQVVPHTDGKRGKFSINWILSSGGNETATFWWQEKNYPVIREPWVLRRYDNLMPVDKIIWKENSWGIFRLDVIHSVMPIFSPRCSFTVSFRDEDLFHHIIDKYGIK